MDWGPVVVRGQTEILKRLRPVKHIYLSLLPTRITDRRGEPSYTSSEKVQRRVLT